MNILKSLWNYRGFIFGSIKRELQSKYQNSLFGVFWVLLNPLAMILVYTVVFSQVMKTRLPGIDSSYAYSIYLCAGTLTWGLFSEITQRMQSCFLDNANLLKKIAFPKLCLPFIILGGALINFLIIFTLFLFFLLITKTFPGIAIFALIPLLFVLLLFAVGLGLTLGVLNVFFRDIGHFFGIFLQFWFWLTPIVYPLGVLPQKAQLIIPLNPLFPVINGFQDVLVLGIFPVWSDLYYPFCVGMILCLIGRYLFRAHIVDMVDEL